MGCDTHSFKVVSFYTPNYEPISRRLVDSLNVLGIKHDVLERASRNNWVKNCAIKPEFIYECWLLSDIPIVWIDADAVVHSFPILFSDLKVDFACHYRNDKRYHNELLSGTLFFNKTVGAKRILELWIEKTKEDDVWDQRTLQETIDSLDDISIHRLPASYTQIYDTMADRGTAVIEHFQESRNQRRVS